MLYVVFAGKFFHQWVLSLSLSLSGLQPNALRACELRSDQPAWPHRTRVQRWRPRSRDAAALRYRAPGGYCAETLATLRGSYVMVSFLKIQMKYRLKFIPHMGSLCSCYKPKAGTPQTTYHPIQRYSKAAPRFGPTGPCTSHWPLLQRHRSWTRLTTRQASRRLGTSRSRMPPSPLGRRSCRRSGATSPAPPPAAAYYNRCHPSSWPPWGRATCRPHTTRPIQADRECQLPCLPGQC